MPGISPATTHAVYNGSTFPHHPRAPLPPLCPHGAEHRRVRPTWLQGKARAGRRRGGREEDGEDGRSAGGGGGGESTVPNYLSSGCPPFLYISRALTAKHLQSPWPGHTGGVQREEGTAELAGFGNFRAYGRGKAHRWGTEAGGDAGCANWQASGTCLRSDGSGQGGVRLWVSP